MNTSKKFFIGTASAMVLLFGGAALAHQGRGPGSADAKAGEHCAGGAHAGHGAMGQHGAGGHGHGSHGAAGHGPHGGAMAMRGGMGAGRHGMMHGEQGAKPQEPGEHRH